MADRSPFNGPEIFDDVVHLLHFSSQGNLEAVTSMIEEGIDINFPDQDGRTALHLAASEGKTEMIRLLLSFGAEVNPLDKWGNTPLADAQRYGFEEACVLLIAAGGATTSEETNSPPALRKLEEPDFEIDPSELEYSNSVVVGKGRLGEVCTAKWRGTQVAVKEIHHELSKIVSIESDLKQELSRLQKLRHPHIVQFLGAVTESKPYLLITEYCPGGTLESFLTDSGHHPVSNTVNFARDLARGLNYLHHRKPQPIVHRHIKPSNLLLDASGHIKISDFGLNGIFSPLFAGLGSHDHNEGFYKYMAPEVFEQAELSPSVDVYSFGMIVYEMIEGTAASKKFKSTDVISFTSDQYPPKFEQMIAACLDRDPRRRPDMDEILTYLEAFSAALEGRDPE